MPRILFAGLFHETHSFVDETTGLDQFRRRDAAGILARRHDLSVVDGFLGVAEREGWTVVPTIDWGATPSGTPSSKPSGGNWNPWRAQHWSTGSTASTSPCTAPSSATLAHSRSVLIS